MPQPGQAGIWRRAGEFGVAVGVLRMAMVFEVEEAEPGRGQDQQQRAHPGDGLVEPVCGEGGAVDGFVIEGEEEDQRDPERQHQRPPERYFCDDGCREDSDQGEMTSEVEQPGAVGLCGQRAALLRAERGHELAVIEGLFHGRLLGAFRRVHDGKASASRAGAAIVQVGAVTAGLIMLWVARSGLGRCAAFGPPTRNPNGRAALRAPRRFRQSPLDGRKERTPRCSTQRESGGEADRPRSGRVARRLDPPREARSGTSRRNTYQFTLKTRCFECLFLKGEAVSPNALTAKRFERKGKLRDALAKAAKRPKVGILNKDKRSKPKAF